MQIVPAIAGVADHVEVFQRSPQWAMPNPNYARIMSEDTQYLMEHVPFYKGWYRLRMLWIQGDRLHAALQIDPDWTDPERSINATNDSVRGFSLPTSWSNLANEPTSYYRRSFPIIRLSESGS